MVELKEHGLEAEDLSLILTSLSLLPPPQLCLFAVRARLSQNYVVLHCLPQLSQ